MLIIRRIVNSSIPFFMYSYAALHIPASLSSIMNSMAAMFGAVLSAIFLIEPLSVRKSIGLIFAIICSALAYLLYYELIKNVGPTKALTVTFLIPVFGIVWGYILLKKAISLSTVIGGCVFCIWK